MAVRVETTIKVYKPDAVVLKQIQGFLDLNEKSMTQAQFLHQMLDFMLKHQEDFFEEIEKQQRENERIMEEWMKVLLKKTKEMRVENL